MDQETMMTISEVQYDLPTIVATDIRIRIPSAIVQQILARSPFISVSGAFNIRDIGATAAPKVRPRYIFRSGHLGRISSYGKIKLSTDVGVKTIFDLRSFSEREKDPSPHIEGVETVWAPSTADGSEELLKNLKPRDFAENDGLDGILNMYSDILQTYKNAFRRVLVHMRDFPEGGILFHCTGKLRYKCISLLRANEY
jgi:protein tyrosine/serine phosphatase